MQICLFIDNPLPVIRILANVASRRSILSQRSQLRSALKFWHLGLQYHEIFEWPYLETLLKIIDQPKVARNQIRTLRGWNSLLIPSSSNSSLQRWGRPLLRWRKAPRAFNFGRWSALSSIILGKTLPTKKPRLKLCPCARRSELRHVSQAAELSGSKSCRSLRYATSGKRCHMLSAAQTLDRGQRSDRAFLANCSYRLFSGAKVTFGHRVTFLYRKTIEAKTTFVCLKVEIITENTWESLGTGTWQITSSKIGSKLQRAHVPSQSVVERSKVWNINLLRMKTISGCWKAT
jgi:hypothetical protein